MLKPKNPPSIYIASVPILLLIFLLTFNVLFFDDTLGGSNQIALILAASVASFIAYRTGKSWNSIRSSIVSSITTSMPSMLILLLIGSLAGTWLISGIVPGMIYYGLEIIHPRIFLFTAVIVSSIVSLVTGSSWSTIATIGIALLGIGNAMGIHPPIVAGAIISGAYFGDKMSPLSDTTNLAPAVSGTDLFTHIRYMTITTVPAMALTLIAFLFIGIFYDFTDIQTNIEQVQQAIYKRFNISLLLFFVPAFLLAMIIKKTAPLPALLTGTLLGAVFAVIFQPELLTQISGISENFFKSSYISVMQAMFGDINIPSNNPVVDKLFTTGGMSGMLNTIWLIIAAMVFGGAMHAGGLLEIISNKIIRIANSSGSLIASTITTSIFFNVTASDQYIALVVPGKMFADSYKKRRLKPEVLSRTLEDGGTVTSVLIPWNTGGATQAKVLGVATIDYLPYCFFNILTPVISTIIGFIGYKIKYYTVDEAEELPMNDSDRKDY
jgi:NhaC family Na+:H+ antiporter